MDSVANHLARLDLSKATPNTSLGGPPLHVEAVEAALEKVIDRTPKNYEDEDNGHGPNDSFITDDDDSKYAKLTQADNVTDNMMHLIQEEIIKKMKIIIENLGNVSVCNTTATELLTQIHRDIEFIHQQVQYYELYEGGSSITEMAKTLILESWREKQRALTDIAQVLANRSPDLTKNNAKTVSTGKPSSY
jgi:hypothetical protein